MTEPETELLAELAEHGILRRVEYVRGRMRGWGLHPGDEAHIDVDDAAKLAPEHPRYVRADHPALPGYYARILTEALEPVEPDDPDELRRRANLDWASAAPADRRSEGAIRDTPGRS